MRCFPCGQPLQIAIGEVQARSARPPSASAQNAMARRRSPSPRSARIVAHARTRSLIGVNATTLIDPGGLNIGRAIRDKATAKGAWVDYGWKDPLTGKVVPKSSWVVRHKGHIFGCGIHKP